MVYIELPTEVRSRKVEAGRDRRVRRHRPFSSSLHSNIKIHFEDDALRTGKSMSHSRCRYLATALALASLLTGLTTIAKAQQASPGIQAPTQSILDPTTQKLYVFGLGSVAIVDISSRQLLGYVPNTDAIDGRGVLLFVNPTTNLVYALNGTTLYVIDSTTDKVVRNVSLPNALGIGLFNQATNQLFISETDPSGVSANLVVYDGSTLAQVDSISEASIAPGLPSFASYILLNPANGKLYFLYASTGGSASGIKVVNFVTHEVLSQTTCDANGCGVSSLRFGGTPTSMVLNPGDNSVWFSTDGTASAGIAAADETGGFVGGSATATQFWQIDPVTNRVGTSFRIYGSAMLFAVDPSTGLLYGVGADMPLVPTGSVTLATPNTTDVIKDLITIDPANPIMTRIGVDDSNITCGTNLLTAFGILGIDLSAGNIYWRCDATASSNATIVVSKMNYVPWLPGVVFPPTNHSALVAQLPTGSADGFFTVMQYGKMTVFGTSDNPAGANHEAFFYSESEDQLNITNPTALFTSTVQFSAPVIPPPPPPTFAVSGRVASTSGLGFAGVPVTITGAATSATGSTDANGAFMFPGILAGTYTVSYGAGGLLPAGPTQQTILVTNTNVAAVNFVAILPIVITGVPIDGQGTTSLTFGPGQFVTANVFINQPAPSGGVVLNLVSSNAKAWKVPATVTVLAGDSGVVIPGTIGGVSSATQATITASYAGTFSPAGTSATSAAITVYPSETFKITGATWSRSSTVLMITATATNPTATATLVDNKNVLIGTMTNLGNGTYSFQQTITTPPSSVSLISSLGGNTGQGVSIVP